MKKKYLTPILVAGAFALLAGTVAGSTRAALTYYSEDYIAQIEVQSIGVTLMEQGAHDDAAKKISFRDYKHRDDAWDQKTGRLLAGMLSGDEKLVPGKAYREELSVQNSGTIDEYVRVTVYKYWVSVDEDKKETKRVDLDPSMIEIGYVTGDGWTIDESAETAERCILYYGDILKSGETTSIFTDTIRINGDIVKCVSQETLTDGTVVTTYLYHDAMFILEASVDAVQTHNAKDAIKSAWGVDVTVDGTTGAITVQQ